MRRNVSALTLRDYDIVVVGGGIFGICAAWDAALRGLSVALVERGDFAHATSANCFKMVHGGIRYLQHGDLRRVRESSSERTTLLRIAPHLASPMPILVPTYGRGLRSKEVLKGGLLLYDLIAFDRNRGLQDPQKRVPRGRAISRQECLELFEGLDDKDLTGAMVFYDGHMPNPPRLALSFLTSAVNAGAEAANYVEATGLIRQADGVAGVVARDTLTGDELRIRGKVVLNAAGPWAEGVLRRSAGLRLHPALSFSRDAAIVVSRRLTEKYALAIQGHTKDPDAMLSRGNRHLFMVPWRGQTLVGVWHVVHRGDPDTLNVTEEDVQSFLDEFNGSYALQKPLTLDDVSMCNAGLTLFGDNSPETTDLSYGKRSRIVDHAKEHGVDGLVTVVGVRYTMARGTGEKAIDLILKKLGGKRPRSRTAATPIHGGHIERFDRFLGKAVEQRPDGLSAEAMRSLARNHGSEYRSVLRYIEDDASLRETVGETDTVKAEVVHAVREEMAQKLGDIVFRRTELGTGGHPGEAALTASADLMAAELGWDEVRKRRELEEVQAAFPRFSMQGSDRVASPRKAEALTSG